MDVRPVSYAPMVHNSLKLFSYATGGSMSAVICHHDYIPSMPDYINDQKWIQPDHIE